MTDNLSDRINKQVSFRFCGRDLSFSLSMGLFSSFDIDAGTRLLLKHLAKNVDFTSMKSILDAGCGTGVIAVSLKKAHPHLQVTALDRDALALSFTTYNAQSNNVEITARAGLDVLSLSSDTASPFSFSLPAEPYSLVVTNIPAKAGESVLKRFFLNGNAILTDDGIFAVVIVAPLRKTAQRLIPETGFEIISSDHTKNHSVFMVKKRVPIEPDRSFPGPYQRLSETLFTIKEITYRLSTVFDIPGFDTVPIPSMLSTVLVRTGIKAGTSPKSILIWNPGQGHSGVGLLTSLAKHVQLNKKVSCTLAGRDLLALLISAENIEQNFKDAHLDINLKHLPGVEWLNGKKIPAQDALQNAERFDIAIIEPDIIPGTDFESFLDVVFPHSLNENGSMILSGKSTDIGRVQPKRIGMSLASSKKTKGFKSILCRVKLQPPAG